MRVLANETHFKVSDFLLSKTPTVVLLICKQMGCCSLHIVIKIAVLQN